MRPGFVPPALIAGFFVLVLAGYRDGEAEHFVELDEDGTLIKAE
jgi:hypothetical protein